MKKKKNDWKIYLYYNGYLIKTMRVDKNFRPMEHFYLIRVIGKKMLVGSNFVKILFKFSDYKYTEGKNLHIELDIYKGGASYEIT